MKQKKHIFFTGIYMMGIILLLSLTYHDIEDTMVALALILLCTWVLSQVRQAFIFHEKEKRHHHTH